MAAASFSPLFAVATPHVDEETSPAEQKLFGVTKGSPAASKCVLRHTLGLACGGRPAARDAPPDERTRARHEANDDDGGAIALLTPVKSAPPCFLDTTLDGPEPDALTYGKGVPAADEVGPLLADALARSMQAENVLAQAAAEEAAKRAAAVSTRSTSSAKRKAEQEVHTCAVTLMAMSAAAGASAAVAVTRVQRSVKRARREAPEAAEAATQPARAKAPVAIPSASGRCECDCGCAHVTTALLRRGCGGEHLCNACGLKQSTKGACTGLTCCAPGAGCTRGWHLPLPPL